MNNRKYCVYMHKNKINGKVYIGATCLIPKKRWANGKGYSGNKKFYKDIVEYGWDNFEHFILEDNLNCNEAKEKEKYYIQFYKGNLYNKTEGGEQGKIAYNNQEEYKKSFCVHSKDYYDNNEEYRKRKIEKQLQKQKEDKAKTNKYHKDYYYKNEKYHQYKVEYQRKYRSMQRELKNATNI